ncbi:hypothetical protein BOW53_06250 [Solemya pervernicosa gill symbiont]|uniref:Semialdehyde dehydrogenase NAD-binding domain-containing protein n=2 Tax=Gammaproteobacteria incertae sedis TaxID=118884 RepID=A0A1T2L793_9GAMM|nr:aspartate-semialdehyde dehydrogenase [Candidatus Reidiella endopervernicosa]OOZ40816.1 hypothetical protein BOW53_06250 [Solemya pervernicosa gill symbiont]QKQ26327.1 aspartate-semialdehyde dehydrogenase [Candidatus Reidiella endopervernicosa]
MTEGVSVALLGATTQAGESVRELLEEREFPLAALYFVEHEERAGGKLSFGGKNLAVQDAEKFDFSTVQIAIVVGDRTLAEQYAEVAATEEVVVVDCTGHSCGALDVPLVIPELNPEALANYRRRNIVAAPNSVSVAMLLALKPIHDSVGIKCVTVTACQAVSELGQPGMEELATQATSMFNLKPIESNVFAKQIAFNILPAVEVVDENGYAESERALVQAAQQILGDETIDVSPTLIWGPVFFGHSMSIDLELSGQLDANAAQKLLDVAPGVSVMNGAEPAQMPTAVTEAAGSDLVYVGRIRQPISGGERLSLWLVTDNVRRGVALNGVQIAEILVKEHLESGN